MPWRMFPLKPTVRDFGPTFLMHSYRLNKLSKAWLAWIRVTHAKPEEYRAFSKEYERKSWGSR